LNVHVHGGDLDVGRVLHDVRHPIAQVVRDLGDVGAELDDDVEVDRDPIVSRDDLDALAQLLGRKDLGDAVLRVGLAIPTIP